MVGRSCVIAIRTPDQRGNATSLQVKVTVLHDQRSKPGGAMFPPPRLFGGMLGVGPNWLRLGCASCNDLP
jgi:hypothetical protein